MKIAFNPSTVAALITPPNNKDITFDLRGRNIFARGVKFCGTDTWRDIKINNVSIGSNILDLRNGSNTTLTNTNGVVTINSTWRPVVDNLTSDSTTSSLSANQGRVLAGLINTLSTNISNQYALRDGSNATGRWRGGLACFDVRDTNYTPHDLNMGLELLFLRNNTNNLKDGGEYNGVFSFRQWSSGSDWSGGKAHQLSFTDNGNIWHRTSSGDDSWGAWKKLVYSTDIPSSLKNPHALTISLNGTSQGPYDGSAAKNINITPSSIGAATSDHNHDDRYYTKAESNAKYITDITTSVNKLTFTKNGSNIDKDIKVNVVYSQGNLTNISDKNATTKASSGLFIYNSYNQVIGTNNYSSVLSINTGGTIQIAGNWGDDQSRNLYWRSQSDRDVSSYPWKSWRTILDSENYSSTLDSRYYTKSEVNNLLDAKLNRQNLSYGTWNPRGYNLAADYSYNGGDLSISESEGKIHISVDGYFWQNEGQYRVLDTSDVAGLKNNLTVHQYLSNTDTTWWPLIWGGSSHNNTSDSTGKVYKSYDKLSWQTSSQTLYATHLRTTDLNTQTALFHPDNDSTLKIYSGRTQDAVSDGHIGLQTSIDNTDGQTHAYPTQHGSRCVLALQPRGGSVYIGNMPNGGNGRKLNVNGDIGLFNVGSIRDLTIGGGIYWNPYVESASDGSDSASITVVRQGVAGGTTLVLSQMNDANDTIQFKTNGSARLYHNSYPILTTQNTYVSNNKGYINGTEITQVNNASNATNSINSNRLSSNSEFALGNNFLQYFNTAGLGSSGVNNAAPDKDWWHIIRMNHPNSKGYFSELAIALNSYNGVYWRTINAGREAKSWTRLANIEDLAWNNIAGKPSSYIPSAHTHTVFKNNLMIKGTNGISDSASIHLGIGDSDTGFKWISDGKCQIYANNSAVGEWTSGGMNWFINPTVNGNKVWNAGNDGSGSGLDADTVDGYHASKFPYINNGIWRIYGNAAVAALADNTAGLSSWAFGESRNYGITYLGILKPSTETCGINAHGTIAVFGQGDTHLGIASDYGRANLQVFGGNADKIVWRKKVAFTDSNVASATKLQTPRTIWGQSFDGTGNVDNTLRIRQTTGNYCEGIRIQTADSTWATIILGATGDSGTNANAWSIHRKADNNFAISRNSSDGTNGLVMTSVGMGLGTTAPTQRLDVHGNIRATGQLYLPTNGNYNAILMGDDCWMGDCNIGDVIGLSGRNNANAGGIKFGKGGMYIGYNGSNHYSSGTSLWSNFNADLLDGYHADNIQSAGWRNLYRTGGSSNVIKWTRIGRCITNANDNAQNDGMIEFHTNGDQNYKYFGYGRLQISQYGQSSRSLMLQSFTSEGIHFYATIDEDNYIWLGHNAWWSGNSAYRVIWSGSYIEWYSSGMSMQTSNPNSVYVTDNGTFKKPNETGFVCLNNVYVEASKLKTARTIWGQRFDGTGNVNGTLQIERASNFGSYNEGIRIVGNSNEWCVIMLGCKAGSYSGVINSQWELMKTASDTFRIGRGSSSSSFLEIINNGNVGIGTTSPAYKLDVVGNIRATGNSYATHFYESSDKTLKKNIKSILSSTNIPKIREFDWKGTGEHSYGFIAQELEEQGYGCLVSEANGKKTVNYTATLALTVAKLQNLINIQNKKISNLTKELKALKYGRKKNS